MTNQKKESKKRRKRRAMGGLMWPIITPQNRRKYEKIYTEEWKARNEERGNPQKLSESEIEKISHAVGMHEVRKIQAGTKAYLKGNDRFKYLGQVHYVETGNLIKEREQFAEMQAKLAKEKQLQENVAQMMEANAEVTEGTIELDEVLNELSTENTAGDVGREEE